MAIALCLGVSALAVAVGMSNNIKPALGDIVAFRAGVDVPQPLRVNVSAELLDTKGVSSGSCVLDPQVIAVEGGSLVVEARRAAGSVVHWAGRRTSAGTTDCGPAADLLLTDVDIARLARVAGGFGVDRKVLAPNLAMAGGAIAMN